MNNIFPCFNMPQRQKSTIHKWASKNALIDHKSKISSNKTIKKEHSPWSSGGTSVTVSPQTPITLWYVSKMTNPASSWWSSWSPFPPALWSSFPFVFHRHLRHSCCWKPHCSPHRNSTGHPTNCLHNDWSADIIIIITWITTKTILHATPHTLWDTLKKHKTKENRECLSFPTFYST